MVDHSVKLRSLGMVRSGGAPLIVERTDRDFIGALLKQLGGDPAGLQPDAMPKTNRPDKPWKLYQPMHRTFYIALLEVICDTALQIRLDPKKIDSAGLVVRRFDDLTGDTQAWLHRDKTIRGWKPIGKVDETRDPDPTRRPPRFRSANAGVVAKLQTLYGESPQDEESCSTLFVAPPEICDPLKRTILYGLVPVVSSEISEEDPQVSSYDDADIVDHLPVYLHAGNAYTAASWQSKTLTFADVAPDLLNADPNQVDMLQFMAMLRQLTLELDAFGPPPQSQTLLTALNTIQLTFAVYTTLDFTTFNPPFSQNVITGTFVRPAGDFLAEAAAILVRGTASGAVLMPLFWPEITADQQTLSVNAFRELMTRQAALAARSETRFQDPTRQYTARAFIRVKRSDGCPPALYWSDPTDFFQIAAWYDDNGLPPAQINLPDLSALKNLKPTVAFKVPKPLFDFLQANSMKDLTDSKGKQGGGGIGLDWICSFSLPSITICAFIVLNIFLSLFDLIFHWLFFIKICIPIPKRK